MLTPRQQANNTKGGDCSPPFALSGNVLRDRFSSVYAGSSIVSTSPLQAFVVWVIKLSSIFAGSSNHKYFTRSNYFYFLYPDQAILEISIVQNPEGPINARMPEAFDVYLNEQGRYEMGFVIIIANNVLNGDRLKIVFTDKDIQGHYCPVKL